MVIAPNYEPLIGDSELHLDARTPQSFDPWEKIRTALGGSREKA